MAKKILDAGFSLRSYTADNLHVQFRSDSVLKQGAKVSLIIGPNGSGKSRLLAEVLDELTMIEEIRSKLIRGEKISSPRGMAANAKVEFKINGLNYRYQRSGGEIACYSDRGKLDPLISPFPKKALAFAHLPVDRFRFSRNERDAFYSYFGLRQATNLTTTGALETKVIFSIFHGYPRPRFMHHVNTWLELLGLDVGAYLTLSDVDNELLNAKTFESFLEIAENLHRRRMGSGRDIVSGPMFEMRLQNFELVWKLLRRISPYKISENNRRSMFRLPIARELFDDEFPPEFWEVALEAGRSTRLIREMGLNFLKSNREIRFSNLSSGEQQVLGTTIRLLSEIEPDSLIVIDEPEVSLHPTWQQRYVPTLLKSLEDFPSTHILIATHSHFLVSDVDPDSSTLLISSLENNFSRFDIFDGDVHGRSPENILYRAFGIGTTGNFFVERDLAKGLQIVSGVVEFDAEELKEIHERLEKVSDQNNEAFQLILDEMKSSLEATLDDNS